MSRENLHQGSNYKTVTRRWVLLSVFSQASVWLFKSFMFTQTFGTICVPFSTFKIIGFWGIQLVLQPVLDQHQILENNANWVFTAARHTCCRLQLKTEGIIQAPHMFQTLSCSSSQPPVIYIDYVSIIDRVT